MEPTSLVAYRSRETNSALQYSLVVVSSYLRQKRTNLAHTWPRDQHFKPMIPGIFYTDPMAVALLVFDRGIQQLGELSSPPLLLSYPLVGDSSLVSGSVLFRLHSFSMDDHYV